MQCNCAVCSGKYAEDHYLRNSWNNCNIVGLPFEITTFYFKARCSLYKYFLMPWSPNGAAVESSRKSLRPYSAICRLKHHPCLCVWNSVVSQGMQIQNSAFPCAIIASLCLPLVIHTCMWRLMILLTVLRITLKIVYKECFLMCLIL